MGTRVSAASPWRQARSPCRYMLLLRGQGCAGELEGCSKCRERELAALHALDIAAAWLARERILKCQMHAKPEGYLCLLFGPSPEVRCHPWWY